VVTDLQSRMIKLTINFAWGGGGGGSVKEEGAREDGAANFSKGGAGWKSHSWVSPRGKARRPGGKVTGVGCEL